MITRRGVVLIAALGATTALAVALGVTDPLGNPDYPRRFMIWNLFLAWLPMIAAIGHRLAVARWLRWTVLAVWVAFLPNSPYLITDLSHLSDGDGALWRHVLQFGFAAWTGTLLGVVSLRIVHADVERHHGRLAGWALVVASTGLCAVGVVIGRFQRWNSWDLITRPDAVAASTFEWVRSPISDVRSTGVALAVAAFFGLAYLTIWAIEGVPSAGHSASGR